LYNKYYQRASEAKQKITALLKAFIEYPTPPFFGKEAPVQNEDRL
jgi:hypothetical protein